jgi:hypothetical protein
MGIGNTAGRYVKSSKDTKQRKYTSYARICVYMDISRALPRYVILEYQDEDWIQTIDYEHIPFHCRKCHEHGHLFRDCPLNAQGPKAQETKQKYGFTTVTSRKKNLPRKQNPGTAPKISTKNSYDILNQLLEDEEIQDPHKEKNQEKGKGQASPSPTQNQEATLGHKPGTNGDIQMQLNDQDIEDIDLEKIEEALNRKDMQTIPLQQLRKFYKVFIDTTAG